MAYEYLMTFQCLTSTLQPTYPAMHCWPRDPYQKRLIGTLSFPRIDRHRHDRRNSLVILCGHLGYFILVA